MCIYVCLCGGGGGRVVGRGKDVLYLMSLRCPRLAYSWARPAILAAGKGRGRMFLFFFFTFLHIPISALSLSFISFKIFLYLFFLSQGNNTK